MEHRTYVLEEGSRWNWFDDSTIRHCAWIAAIAGVLFVIRSLTFARSVVDLRALKNRNFAVGCFLCFVTGIGIFSTIYLTPLFLGYVRGYSAWQTGIAIFSTDVASIAAVPVYVLLARKVDTRWLMMFGLASFGLSMWAFSMDVSSHLMSTCFFAEGGHLPASLKLMLWARVGVKVA
jgi:MFS transporter, DHA2 family, multidrug resistance protein